MTGSAPKHRLLWGGTATCSGCLAALSLQRPQQRPAKRQKGAWHAAARPANCPTRPMCKGFPTQATCIQWQPSANRCERSGCIGQRMIHCTVNVGSSWEHQRRTADQLLQNNWKGAMSPNQNEQNMHCIHHRRGGLAQQCWIINMHQNEGGGGRIFGKCKGKWSTARKNVRTYAALWPTSPAFSVTVHRGPSRA